MATAPTPHSRPYLVPAQRKARTTPLALWHLLSLDAPTVAALWTWFLARANHIALPWTSIAAMTTAVWLLYAADRLLDARTPQHLEARHRFHHRYRSAFLTGIVTAVLALAALLPALEAAAIRLYLVEASFLVGYFILIHATRSAHRLPKELAVGLFFAAATFIPTIARNPALRPALLGPALLFAILCSLNCLFIYEWEHPASKSDTHLATRFALRHLRAIALTLFASATALALIQRSPIPAAIALATLFLLLLHHSRDRFTATTLRAAADLALLTPLLVLPLL